MIFDDYRKEVLEKLNLKQNPTFKDLLCTAGLGVAGEAGEVADLIKKHLFHNEPGAVPDYSAFYKNLALEMGDVYWYLELLGAITCINTEDILRLNVEKLNKRHPNGWSAESQRVKVDETGPFDEVKELYLKALENCGWGAVNQEAGCPERLKK